MDNVHAPVTNSMSGDSELTEEVKLVKLDRVAQMVTDPPRDNSLNPFEKSTSLQTTNLILPKFRAPKS